MVDLIEAGAAMADGIFKVVAKRADGIDFSFFANDRTYRLTWSDEPGWAAPFSMPTGFSYKHRLARHYLTIRQVQTGESG